jgi:hypothetical protein
MARILHDFGAVPPRRSHLAELQSPCRRLDLIMKTDSGLFGLVVGGIVALAVVVFILSGGEFGGKKTIEGDDDLPPVVSTTR